MDADVAYRDSFTTCLKLRGILASVPVVKKAPLGAFFIALTIDIMGISVKNVRRTTASYFPAPFCNDSRVSVSKTWLFSLSNIPEEWLSRPPASQ